jgi:hypothetical protein
MYVIEIRFDVYDETRCHVGGVAGEVTRIDVVAFAVIKDQVPRCFERRLVLLVMDEVPGAYSEDGFNYGDE